jgi:uncharacterized protein with GYD domain
VAEAFMLIQTEVGRAEVVAKQVAALAGVVSSEYVTGPYDVVVRVGAEGPDASQTDALQAIVAAVQGVEGITRTLTCPITGASH